MKIPRNLGTPLLFAASGIWAAGLPLLAGAAPGIAVVSVRVMVSPTVKMKFESSSMQVSITEEDIARGYIDVPGTNRLTMTADRSAQQLANVTIDYEPNPYNFSSIQLATNTMPERGRNADTNLSGLLDTLPSTAAGPSDDALQSETDPVASTSPKPVGARGSVTSLGYRLMLPKSIKPGDISVPVTLNIQL